MNNSLNSNEIANEELKSFEKQNEQLTLGDNLNCKTVALAMAFSAACMTVTDQAKAATTSLMEETPNVAPAPAFANNKVNESVITVDSKILPMSMHDAIRLGGEVITYQDIAKIDNPLTPEIDKYWNNEQKPLVLKEKSPFKIDPITPNEVRLVMTEVFKNHYGEEFESNTSYQEWLSKIEKLEQGQYRSANLDELASIITKFSSNLKEFEHTDKDGNTQKGIAPFENQMKALIGISSLYLNSKEELPHNPLALNSDLYYVLQTTGERDNLDASKIFLKEEAYTRRGLLAEQGKTFIYTPVDFSLVKDFEDEYGFTLPEEMMQDLESYYKGYKNIVNNIEAQKQADLAKINDPKKKDKLVARFMKKGLSEEEATAKYEESFTKAIARTESKYQEQLDQLNSMDLVIQAQVVDRYNAIKELNLSDRKETKLVKSLFEGYSAIDQSAKELAGGKDITVKNIDKIYDSFVQNEILLSENKISAEKLLKGNKLLLLGAYHTSSSIESKDFVGIYLETIKKNISKV